MTKWVGVGAALLLAAALTGCGTNSKPGDVLPPVTMSANDLQGAEVDLLVGQALNITVGDLAVDSYTAEISDGAVVEFVQGKNDGSAEFNPGLLALAAGTSDVVMTNAQGGIQPLSFTVTVTAAAK